MNIGQVENEAFEGMVQVTNDKEINALKDLSNATHSGSLCGFALLVRDGEILSSELSTDLKFGERIDEQSEAHNHNHSHDASRTFEKKRIGKEKGVTEEAEAPFDGSALLFVDTEKLVIGQALLIEDVGGNDEASKSLASLLDGILFENERATQLIANDLRDGIFGGAPRLGILFERKKLGLRLMPRQFLAELSSGTLCISSTGKG